MEDFVAEMYRGSEELIADRNVKEYGKSEAKYQIDVRVIQQTKFHSIKILVYCKYFSIIELNFPTLPSSLKTILRSSGILDRVIKLLQERPDFDLYPTEEIQQLGPLAVSVCFKSTKAGWNFKKC